MYDARGSFVEPHTGHEVRLGTIDVRTYLGERPAPAAAVAVTRSDLYPTIGPLHRYAAVLFIEKEGFAPLFQAARVAERFDVAVMSTKGIPPRRRGCCWTLAPRIERCWCCTTST